MEAATAGDVKIGLVTTPPACSTADPRDFEVLDLDDDERRPRRFAGVGLEPQVDVAGHRAGIGRTEVQPNAVT